MEIMWQLYFNHPFKLMLLKKMQYFVIVCNVSICKKIMNFNDNIW